MVESDCEFIERVGDQLVVAAREGDFGALQSCLDTVPNPEDYINRLYGGELSINRTLLTIACLNEHEDFVRQFLFHHKPNLEVLNVLENSKTVHKIGEHVLGYRLCGWRHSWITSR